MMQKEDIAYYIRGYINNTLSDAERHIFLTEVIREENKETYQEVAASLLEDAPVLAPFDEKLWPLFNNAIQADKPSPVVKSITNHPVHRLHSLRKWRWAAAAVILLAASGALVMHQIKTQSTKNGSAAIAAADIAPGREGAVLTLANGQQVVLDSLKNGLIASQNGANVVLTNGQLSYGPAVANPDEVVYNTMTTPKGRQFQLTLPDGTQVWLNSASSIRFPTTFTGKERRVEIIGEAYFEVAKNAQMPFRLDVGDKMEIEVLGTHFNVQAYNNDNTLKTTLLEGSVRVKAQPRAKQTSQSTTVLTPGQQAQINQNAADTKSVSVINDADIDKVMAWKNGHFNFEGASLEEVMKQLERWYDIEVVYESGIPDIAFVGKMTKDIPLSGLLIMLEKSKVHTRLEGRKLVVLP